MDYSQLGQPLFLATKGRHLRTYPPNRIRLVDLVKRGILPRVLLEDILHDVGFDRAYCSP
jgi:hypothetical protein